MRSFLLLVILFYCGLSYGQGSGFSFSYTGPTQILVGQDCVAPLEWGHPNTPTASSNLPGGIIVSFNIYSISGGVDIGDDVGGGTVVTVFYQAIDNFGNSALFGFSIAFVDNIPPVFDPLSLPPNLTVNCIGNFPVAAVEVHDNCEDQDIVLTVTFTETNNALMCTGGIITRKWVADDDLGNFATFTQTITVLPDNTPPVIANNLMNGSAPCVNAMAQYTTWLTAQRAAFSATDNGCGLMTLSDNAPSPSGITSFCGVITVTFSAKDNCNNISTIQRTFTITNSVPPVITTPASGASGNCSQSNIGQIFNSWINTHGGATATDDCSSVVWSTSPPSPSLSGTCDTLITVLFIAGDGCSNFDTTSASFMLTDDTPPAITVDPSTVILSCTATTIDSLLMDWLITSGHSTAHDLCTSDPQLIRGYMLGGNSLTIEQVLDAWQDSLAAGCTDNVIINGIGINNVLGYLAVEFTYEDACQNQAGDIGFFGITDNGRPVFDTLPSDSSFVCSENENWEDVFMVWYNSAGGATYSDQCSNVDVQASITADSALQYLTAALDTACMQGAGVTIQFSLIDGCGNISIAMPTASFSLQDTIPPQLITIASDFIASCSLNGQTQLNNWLDTLGGATATDGCGSLSWVFTWTDTSGVINNGTPGTGPYPQLSTLSCSSGLEVTFTVSDICQNTVSDTAVFSLIDTIPPVITIIDDSVDLSCQQAIPLDTPGVVDGCNGEILLTFVEVAGIDSCGGLPEMVTRTWTATDECGNSSTAEEIFFRIDSIAPTFQLPSSVIEFCDVDTLMLINLVDNCDPSPVSSFEDVLSGSPCQLMLTRTWTVSDACGNSDTAVQVFDLSDISPPVIQYSPGNFIYTCSEGDVQDAYEQWMDSVTVVDGCSDVDYFIAVPGSYLPGDTSTWPGTPLPDSVSLSCAIDIVVTGELVVFDACGNVITEQISFSVIDNTPPVINCPPLIQVVPDTSTCSGIVHLVTPVVEEICYPEVTQLFLVINHGDTIMLDSTGMLDTILEVGIHTALWIATDCKGNSGTCQTTIEIIDENAVSLTCPGDTLLFASESSCIDSLWIYPPFTTSGTCAKGVIELRFEIEGNATPDSVVFDSPTDSVLVTFMAGIQQVSLIARDSTGDIDTCRYIIELRDTIAPFVICQNDTLLLHPAGGEDIDLSVTSLVVSTADNCVVENILYNPQTINCNTAGQNIDVMIVVLDGSGNSDTCTSSLFVATQTLSPLWERGLCDDTLRLFANIPPGPAVMYTYNWTGPNGFISNEENPIIPGADTSYSGTYILTVISENGCISSGSVEVLIQTLVSPQIIVIDDTLCTNEELLLTTQTYSGIVSYQWHQISPAGDTVIFTTTDPSFLFNPVNEGAYTFFAVVIQDTCVSSPGPDVGVFVFARPEVSIADISLPLCAYDTLFLTPNIIEDTLTYLWTGPGGFTSNLPAPPGIPANEIGSPAVYFLTASDAHCSSALDSFEIIIQPALLTPNITGENATCEGGSFSLTASTAGDLYIWIDPLLNTTQTITNTLNVVPASISHEGEWRVIAFQNGCHSDTSDAFIVQVDTALVLEIVAPSIACEGDSISLSVTPFVDGIFAWSGPGGFASDENSPTTVAASGIYNVFVQTATGCESSDSHAIEVDILPSIILLSTDAGNCVDVNSDIRLWATVEPASGDSFIYQWSGPGGFASQDSSPVIQNFNSGLNGVYTLYIINGTCTSNLASIELNVTDSPDAPEISGQTSYCFGDTILLSIQSPVAGGTYTWSFGDSVFIIPSPGTLIIPGADQAMSGIYSVDVIVNGCFSAQSTITIQVSASLTAPVITNPTLICEGDSLILTSNAPIGASVQWFGPNGFSSNETNPIIYPVLPGDAGFYTALYFLNGCASDTSLAVEISIQSTITSPLLFADVSSICIDNPHPFTICIDELTQTGNAVYTWVLNGGFNLSGPSTDSCIVVDGSLLQGGTNTITAIASLQGCISDSSAAFVITGDEFPAIQADAGIDMQYCPEENIVLDASDPSPATGTWTSTSGLVVFDNINNPGTTIQSLPTGEYELVWTLSFATCTNYSTDNVLISIIPSPLVLSDTVTVPFGQTVEFIVTTNDTLNGIPFTLEIVSGPEKGNTLHAGNGIFRYTPDVGFVGVDMFVYRICSTDCPEECSEAIVILNVGNDDDCFTPTLFTPNQDNVNDFLVFPCLETSLFPDNKIIVFNEWGDAVFTAEPYQNDWDGSFSGEGLPVGTYFYIMDFGDGSEPKKSFLVLER